MNPWLTASLIAMANFGLWGLFTKLAVDHIDAKSAFFYQTIGAAVVGLLGLYIIGLKPMVDTRGIIFGLLTGASYSLGCLFFFFPASRGNIMTVVTLTALYPIVTIILSYLFFHDVVSLRQSAGIILAITAMYLFAS